MGNAWYPGTQAGLPIDAYGNAVPASQARYVSMIVNYGYGPQLTWVNNPNYGTGTGSTSASSPAPAGPQYQFTFDTIGQTIYRTIGHCLLPLRLIWAQGISESGQLVGSTVIDSTTGLPTTTAPTTITFAAALCAPIDPDEEGIVSALIMGGIAIFDNGGGGFIAPVGMDPTTAALLEASVNSAVVYPGDEAQEPAPLIVADKGAAATNAFRGLRYIIFPNYPLAAGLPTNLSVQWQRTNTLSGAYTPAAVEFAAGTG
jgi:hypothetical protein